MSVTLVHPLVLYRRLLICIKSKLHNWIKDLGGSGLYSDICRIKGSVTPFVSVS